MNKPRFTFCFLLAFIITFFSGNFSNVFAESSDINDHWAYPQIEKWMNYGLVNGYSNGTFMPDTTITRAEFFALVNRVFNYKNKAASMFTDVTSSDWYTEDVQKAVKAGYVNGYADGSVQPNNPVTRQEAAKILAIAFSLDNKPSTYYLNFKDASSIQDWAVNYVGKLAEMQVIKGYDTGIFAPDNFVTRAEAVTMLDRICGEILNQENTSFEGKNINGNLLINKPNIHLKDTVIEGNLYLTEGIDSGEMEIDNVTVKGSLYINGCKLSKITILGSNIREMIVNTPDFPIKITTKNLTANTISVETPVNLDIFDGSSLNEIKLDAKSEVNVSEQAELNSINVSGKATESVIVSKQGVTIDSEANAIFVNGKKFNKGTSVTENYTFDIIDVN